MIFDRPMADSLCHRNFCSCMDNMLNVLINTTTTINIHTFPWRSKGETENGRESNCRNRKRRRKNIDTVHAD